MKIATDNHWPARMRQVSAALLPLVLWISCGLSACMAHQKWLWPNTFAEPKAPVWVSFDVTWGDRPFAAESGVGEQPIEVVGPDGQRLAPSQVFVGKTKSTAEIQITKAGTYRLQAVDPLTYWTQVEQDGRQRWLKQPKTEVTDARITRSDLYWSKASAYVSVGEPTELLPADDTEPLAILPATHPNRLTAGTSLELRVLSYGKPVPNAEIHVFSEDSTAHEPTAKVQCNEEGIGSVQLAAPGRWLVSCQFEREAADDPKADLHSFNVYLTLLVQPATE